MQWILYPAICPSTCSPSDRVVLHSVGGTEGIPAEAFLPQEETACHLAENQLGQAVGKERAYLAVVLQPYSGEEKACLPAALVPPVLVVRPVAYSAAGKASEAYWAQGPHDP
jgi:hypothetical protein